MEDEEEDMVEGVEPKAPGAEFRLWEEEEEEEWAELDDVDWSPGVVSENGQSRRYYIVWSNNSLCVSEVYPNSVQQKVTDMLEATYKLKGH